MLSTIENPRDFVVLRIVVPRIGGDAQLRSIAFSPIGVPTPRLNRYKPHGPTFPRKMRPQPADIRSMHLSAPHIDRGPAHRRAFSIIEMLIVISIISIIAAVAVPTIGSLNTTRLSCAANLVAADLSYAQVESLAHGDDLRLFIINATSTGYSIAPASNTAAPITDPISNQPYNVTFGQGRARKATGVSFSAFSLGGDRQLKFLAFGQTDQPANTNATLTLAASGKSVTITVDANTGQVTVGAVQ